MQMSWQLAGGERADWMWDRALRFGMSVFETIAVVSGRALFYREHLDRLGRAARNLLGAEMPEFERNPARELAAIAATGVLRIYVTAGPGGVSDPVPAPGAFALFESCAVEAGPGVGLRVALGRAPVVPPPGGWKTGNYWQNARARREALEAGCAEILVAGPSGAVTGASMGNVFAVMGGRLVTPSLDTGARPGVVRAWVLDQTSCSEEWLTFADFQRAEEIFLTNSRMGIARVTELDGRVLAQDAFTSDLSTRYRDEILQS